MRVLAQLPLDHRVREALHPVRVDDYARRLAQRSATVSVDGARVGSFWRFDLLALAVDEHVRGLLAVVVALLDEGDLMACSCGCDGGPEVESLASLARAVSVGCDSVLMASDGGYTVPICAVDDLVDYADALLAAPRFSPTSVVCLRASAHEEAPGAPMGMFAPSALRRFGVPAGCIVVSMGVRGGGGCEMEIEGAGSASRGGRGDEPRLKPALTVKQQIEHLKTRGVKFELCSEAEAAEYLSRSNNYLRTASYRKLFPVREGGEHAGEYVGLDFAKLVALSQIDRRLREAMLLATVDVEHFARVKVNRLCEEHGEDGYAVVSDFFSSLDRDARRRMLGNLKRRAEEGAAHDMYTGDLLAHYGVDGLPVWVLTEALEFGPFLTFYKHCAERWDNRDMLQEHYVLKSVKSLRNAAAHNSCIVNGFRRDAGRAGYRTPALITDSLNAAGMKNTRTRRAKLSNPRVAQIAAALFAVSTLGGSDATVRRHAERMESLRGYVGRKIPLIGGGGGVVSYFDFIWKLVDIWLPMG